MRVLFNRVLTFLVVMIAWCFFRADSVPAAINVLAGLGGFNGVTPVLDLASWDYWLVAVSAFIAFLMPNTNEIILYFENRYPNALASFSLWRLQWRPSLGWALITGMLLAISILGMDRPTDFIYAQF